MIVLGIRNYSDGFRYCLLEKDSNGITCLNLNSENRVLIPKGFDDNQMLIWYQDEIKRVLDTNDRIDRVTIKHN